jgi:hypothetical protein
MNKNGIRMQNLDTRFTVMKSESTPVPTGYFYLLYSLQNNKALKQKKNANSILLLFSKIEYSFLEEQGYLRIQNIQGDSKRWTQFRTSMFSELYMVCE